MSDVKLKHYLNGYFVEEYMRYLEDSDNESCPYVDIDGVTAARADFYNDLKEFLNKALNPKYKFKVSQKPFAIELQIPDSECIYLRPDQLGFSAPRGDKKKPVAWGDRYPYGRYLSVDSDNLEEKRRFVAECIYETRTIGGGFLWPVVKQEDGKYRSQYNMQRGVRGYIEDRVDITLYEIRCFYDVFSKIKEKNINDKEEFKEFQKEYQKFVVEHKWNKPILFQLLFQQCEPENELKKRAIYQWLKIFGDFNGYVEKLKFEPFVFKQDGSYVIRNMASEDACSKLDVDKIEKIEEMNSDKLRILLTNVKECTEERTKSIIDSFNGSGGDGY